MRIDHIAVWTAHLERLRSFYEAYFEAKAGPVHESPGIGFRSSFLAFGGDGGARLELMQMPGIPPSPGDVETQHLGLIHVAVALGSTAEVDELTRRLERDGHRVVEQPHATDDGFYESTILDPDGNRIELTVPAGAPL